MIVFVEYLSKYQKIFPAKIKCHNASGKGLSESMEFGSWHSIPVQAVGRGACAHGYEEAQPRPLN